MDIKFIIASIVVFWAIIFVLVIILLIAKKYLLPSGKVNITINGKETLSVDQGASLLSTLSENGVFLSSACGGKGSCGQCKCQVLSGGGEILDVEKQHFTQGSAQPLPSGLPVQGERRPGGGCARIRARRERVGVHRHQQQERQLVHQRVHRSSSSW